MMIETVKKIVIIFFFGYALYLVSSFFMGAAMVGGLIWEVVGALVIGGLGVGIGKKITDSDTWNKGGEK